MIRLACRGPSIVVQISEVCPTKLLLLLILCITLNFVTVENLNAAQNIIPILSRVSEIKDPSKRIEMLDEALQGEGLNGQTLASLYLERAIALKEMKEYFRALEDLDSAMSHSKRLSNALLEKAECLTMVDQLDQASLALENYLVTRSGTARAYTLRGKIYEKEEAFLKAEDEYGRALRYDPSYLPAMDARAKVLMRVGKPKKALQDLDTMANLAPKDPDVLIFRASVHSKMRDYKSALADYAKADSLKPNNEKIRKDRVLTYLKIGKPEKALEILSQHAASPDDVDSPILSARAYIHSKNFSKAETILGQVQTKWPNSAEGRLLQGVIHSRRSELDAALTNLNAAIELDPKLVEAYKERARALTELKEYVRAVNDLTSASQIDPADGEIFVLRGETQCQRGMFDSAASDFSQALETMNDDPRVLYDRGLVHLRQQDFQRAFNDMERVCNLKPGSARAFSMRGVARFLMGDLEKSIADIEKSFSLDSHDPLVLNNRGFFYLKVGNYPAAKLDFERALAISPSFLDAKQNLKLVESRELQETLYGERFNAGQGNK
ncbi:MAG: tetratricopeptide repeat protein [Desulfomonilaceae bacterium]